MRLTSTVVVAGALAAFAAASPVQNPPPVGPLSLRSHPAPQSLAFESWKTFKANGVNLGSWMEIEVTYAPGVIGDGYDDEWTWCEAVGHAVCGPILEKHYASYVTKADIDKIAQYGVNTVRIAMTYQAFYKVPGSQLYHGKQLHYLKKISEYAIKKYNMHVIIGLHSLPGGVNLLEIGEAVGHNYWWQNATNMAHSLKVVDKVLDFIEASPYAKAYTFSPINEPCDNITNIFTDKAVSYPSGVNWVNKYYFAIYKKIQERKMPNTLMLSDAYMGTPYWSKYWPAGSNIAFDTHKYYFANELATSLTIVSSLHFILTKVLADDLVSPQPELACAAAKNATTNFPVYVGEFATLAFANNTLSERKTIVQTQIYAWSKYLSGGTFWNIKYLGNATATGEGHAVSHLPQFLHDRIPYSQFLTLQRDYWSYENLIDAGMLNKGGHLTHVHKDC
ncbi:hypothetical protein P7C70_g2346, partial [Phenoliferia sp. Uapishka_3]